MIGNKRRVVAVLAGLAVLAGFGGLVLQHEAQAKPEKDLFVIKTWTRKDCSVTPWTVADRLGFLAEEGIRLEYTGETQPALQIPSILRGNNDVGTFHPNTIAVAKAGGAQVTGVLQGGLEPTDPKIPEKLRHMFWYVNPQKHREIKRFSDLKKIPGKIKISTITKNVCADFETNLLADKYGIPRSKFEWVTMPDVQAIQALKQGLVDISEVHPPFYKGMHDAGAHKVADTFETGLGASAGLTYYIFRDDFIRKHPQQVAAFTRAMTKAQRWANANPLKAQKLTEEAIGVPVTGNHWYSEVTRIDEKLSAPWIRDLETNRVIPKGKVTTANLVTHDIEKINLQVLAERSKK
ncbi:ABC transporter substrate-binding protein [Geomesophilobacter sediminis]|uniref:ABC transporter substrate-binding protein n=1 Tax=Geomesophilobacter sediminis TaxID=2798584 RepID=A0A8J7IPM9_9BACT|nr:ABC transporter substrate-binding protein [Geomesophilobacter sediminis]MBJ6724384.1 ABC transporter substrate-binding protein [Geomesophilobacter sediminis]